MSTYENYNLASRLYDNQRVAVGADVMVAMIQLYTGKSLKDLDVLDAGCGTGSYAGALINFGVGHVTLLDASLGMLEKAREKYGEYIATGAISDVIEATMPPIPFPDNSFDVVMFNVVLNHLDRNDPSFPNAVKTLKESKRILRPNGVIIMSTILSSTTSRVLWFTQLNKQLTERFVKDVVPSLEQYEKMFDDAGITCIQKMNILGSDMYKQYLYLDGPLDEAWRKTSSYWSYATESEVDEVIKKVKDLKDKGELEDWVKAHDHTSTSGVLSIFICKPLSQ